MEILVGVLVVLGVLAILARFVTRDASGGIRLPRVVDDSIGMWTLRRITGRRLGERVGDEDTDGGLQLDPNASDATRAALGAIAATNAATMARPTFTPVRTESVAGVTPARMAPAYMARRRATKGRSTRGSLMASATPVLDLRRRQEALTRPRRSPWRHRIATLATIAAVVIAAAVAIAGLMLQSPRGHPL